MNQRREVVVALSLAAIVSFGPSEGYTAEKLRIGWQIPWATQGQLVSVLKRTNIPHLVGAELEFIGFSYGAPLNAAALSGQVDVVLTADQPAFTLVSAKVDFRIVSRLMHNRTCLYVPVNSEIKSLNQLAGKTILGPVGAAAERVAIDALRSAEVDLKSVKFGNLDMAQQSALLRSSEAARTWSIADALFGFDPFPAIFEQNGVARMLHCGQVVSVVLASANAISNRRSDLQKFLQSLVLAWAWFAQNPSKANEWFRDESRLDVADEILDRVAIVEHNRTARLADVDIAFSGGDLVNLRKTIDYLKERGLLRRPVDLSLSLDTSLLTDALRSYDAEQSFSAVTTQR